MKILLYLLENFSKFFKTAQKYNLEKQRIELKWNQSVERILLKEKRAERKDSAMSFVRGAAKKEC